METLNEHQSVNAQDEQIDTWAYVEIFGHHQLAGRVQSRKFGTQIMLQVDVPKGDKEMCHSELYSPSSIFSIKPTTEEWCRRWCANNRGSTSILPYIPEQRSPSLIAGAGYDASFEQNEDRDQL